MTRENYSRLTLDQLISKEISLYFELNELEIQKEKLQKTLDDVEKLKREYKETNKID